MSREFEEVKICAGCQRDVDYCLCDAFKSEEETKRRTREKMSSREFEFETDAVCDQCGETGAFDIYGDYYCSGCLVELGEWEGHE